MFIGSQLRQLRRQQLLSQQELATRSGVAQPTISALEANEREARYVTIKKLALALGVDAGLLIAQPQTERMQEAAR